MEFHARNYNLMAPKVYQALQEHGIRQPSRNGDVLRIDEVVTMTVEAPWERVNFCPVRRANPFFHLMEAAAMIAGFNSVPFLAHFAQNIANYSDDGETFNAFYGTRLLRAGHRHFDQLGAIANNLHHDSRSRREVALLWDAEDLTRATRDKACNLMMVFSVNDKGAVEMTSFNRSNDAIWGMVTGANVVHLSMFQEVVACALDRPMGKWQHVTANLHVYLDNPQWQKLISEDLAHWTPEEYPLRMSLRQTAPPVNPRPEEWVRALREDFGATLQELAEATLGLPRLGLLHASPASNTFARRVLRPAFHAWQAYKEDRLHRALNAANSIGSIDWRMACVRWLTSSRKYQRKISTNMSND